MPPEVGELVLGLIHNYLTILIFNFANTTKCEGFDLHIFQSGCGSCCVLIAVRTMDLN